MNATGGLLPKVIAAYNAGPAPVIRWNSEIRDQGDPLLFMESIPYWETRGYVAIILRNYWIYEAQKGKNGGSMCDIGAISMAAFPAKWRKHCCAYEQRQPQQRRQLCRSMRPKPLSQSTLHC